MSLLGIDVGTSGVKASVVGREGRVLSSAGCTYALHNPAPGVFELNPDQVWEAVECVVRSVVRDTAGDPVEAACTSSLGESFVLLDANGRVLANSPMYFDARGEEETTQLLAFDDARGWMEHVGLRPDRQQSLPKLMWMATHRPEVLSKARRLHFFADYILCRLGAPHVTDGSLAATSMMLNYRTMDWWPPAVRLSGLDPAVLPRVLPAGTVLGKIDAQVAHILGLSADVRLVLGGHDQMMCALGCGIIGGRVATNSMGTSDAITPLVWGAESAGRLFDAGYRLAPFSAVENAFLSSIYNLNGGALLKWFHETFRTGEEGYARMEAEMPEGPTGIVVLPNFAGRQGVSGAEGMRGALLGLNYDVGAPDIYKAVLEGQAFELKMWMERFEEGVGEIHALNVTGGVARSDVNLQLRADIFGKPIHRLACDEAGALGNAMVAGVAIGAFSGLRDAARALVRVEKTFEPDPRHQALYLRSYEDYKRFYGILA